MSHYINENAPYSVVPMYASAAPGKKPTKFKVEDKNGVEESTHLYRPDALKRANELNKKIKHKTRMI